MSVSYASKVMESQQLQNEYVITNAQKVLSLRSMRSQIEAIDATLAKKIAILALVLHSAQPVKQEHHYSTMDHQESVISSVQKDSTLRIKARIASVWLVIKTAWDVLVQR